MPGDAKTRTHVHILARGNCISFRALIRDSAARTRTHACDWNFI